MTKDEQQTICRALVRACMWGQGGIASVIRDELQKAFPMQPTWDEVYNANAKDAKREHMGVITDEEELQDLLRRGYWLTNGDSLFNPPPMNGLCKYVAKELYDKHSHQS